MFLAGSQGPVDLVARPEHLDNSVLAAEDAPASEAVNQTKQTESQDDKGPRATKDRRASQGHLVSIA
jgi:hypothetical protein